jgi:hypothetical protein
VSSIDSPDNQRGFETTDSLRNEFERYRDYENRRKVTRFILIVLLILLVFFIRLMPLDWASGSVGNWLGVTNIFNSNSGSVPLASPTDGSHANHSGGSGSESGTVGQTNYVAGPTGAPGPAGARGASGHAGSTGAAGANGKDGVMSQVGYANGQASIGACDTSVNISMRSVWNPRVQPGGNFTLAQIRIFNVDSACNGLNLMVDLIDASGNSMLAAPIDLQSLNVGANGEILLTSTNYSAFRSVISNQIDKLVLEVAS